MDDDERTVAVLTEDLLRQVLKNQMAILAWLADKTPETAAAAIGVTKETGALLDKME